MSLTTKWINAIFSIATGSKKTRDVLTPIGVLFFLSACTGLILISLYLDTVFGFTGFINFPLSLIAGLLFLIPGAALALMCVAFFAKSGGTPLPINPPPEIIKNGPYSFSRNPMVTGLLLQFFGFGLIMDSVSLTFITSPLLTLLMAAELKFIEEPELIKRFGHGYREYMKEVPMFVPVIRRKKKS